MQRLDLKAYRVEDGWRVEPQPNHSIVRKSELDLAIQVRNLMHATTVRFTFVAPGEIYDGVFAEYFFGSHSS